MIKPLPFLMVLLLAAACWQCTAEAKPEPTPPSRETAATSADLGAATGWRTFTTLKASPQDQESVTPVTGRIAALEQIPIIAEVQGQVAPGAKLLQEGIRYQKGETLVQIADDQYRLGVQAQRSQFQASLVQVMSQIQLDYPAAHGAWNAYLRAFSATETLAPLPAITDEQLRYFLAAQGIFVNYYNIKSAEELLPKYHIRAPFNGVVTAGSVSAGTVVSPGARLGSFSRTDVYEFRANLSTADIDKVKVGQKLQLRQRASGKRYTGTVHRIGGTIDAGTQAIPVFVRLSGKALRDGMFLETQITTDALKGAVALPLHALTRDNQVHLIRDSTVVLQPVSPAHYAEDVVWVTGLEAGAEVITEPLTEPIVGLRALPKK